MGIICNVNNIKRKPEHEALQEDPQDLDQETASLHTSGAQSTSTNGSHIAGQINATAETAVPDDVVDIKDVDSDDVNLFEEEQQLNLIDRDAEAAKEHSNLSNEQKDLGEHAIEDEANTKVPLSTTLPSSTLASNQAKQPSKKKTKYKPTPQRKDPDKPVIMILDSLRGTHSQATRALREWLEAEGLDKRGLSVEMDNRGHYPKESQIPMQRNFSDCGLYVLGYLRKFFADPDDFRVKLLQQQMSAESDWPEMNPSKMRNNIRELIFRLNEARDGARREAHKAKRIINDKDSTKSLADIGSEQSKSALKLPDATKAQAAATASMVTELAPNLTATTGNKSPPPIGTPRLGSPLIADAGPEAVPPCLIGAAQKDNTFSASSKTPERPKTPSLKRTKSPEVRVPTQSPRLDLSTYEPYDAGGDGSQRPVRQPADSRSLQERCSKEDGKLRMLSVKKAQASSPPSRTRELPTNSSPPQARTRSGSHDDPITLDDSQDLDAPVRKQLHLVEKPLAKRSGLDRSQEIVQAPVLRVNHQTYSSPVQRREARRQIINRDDSLLEVDRHQWEENRDITRALKESLVDERERLARLASHRPYEPDEPMEDVVDAQAANSQSSLTVHETPDTQEAQPMEVDDDDQVIPESPVQRRSSPPLDVEMLD